MKTKQLAVLGVLGAIVALAATRKPKRTSKTTTTTPPERKLEDEGVGYAEELERNVRWSVFHIGDYYAWSWTAVDDPELTSGDVSKPNDGPPYSSSEEAYAAMKEEIGLLEHPKPPPPGQPQQGEGEPPPPHEPPPPGPGGILQPPLEEAPLPPPEAVSLFDAQVYPEDADKSKLPALYDPMGLIMSEDGTVAGVGPQWWDAVGERAEHLYGQGVNDREGLLSTLIDENFPPNHEPSLYPGLLALYNELANKVDVFLSSVS